MKAAGQSYWYSRNIDSRENTEYKAAYHIGTLETLIPEKVQNTNVTDRVT